MTIQGKLEEIKRNFLLEGDPKKKQEILFKDMDWLIKTLEATLNDFEALRANVRVPLIRISTFDHIFKLHKCADADCSLCFTAKRMEVKEQ